MGYTPGDEHLFTQGEAIDERYWYPCYDSPNEKFTTEITCHVPAGMTALSNGRLVSEEKDPAGLTAFHWSQEQPHANYLVSLVAGYFKKVEDKYKDIPLALYTPAFGHQRGAQFISRHARHHGVLRERNRRALSVGQVLPGARAGFHGRRDGKHQHHDADRKHLVHQRDRKHPQQPGLGRA